MLENNSKSVVVLGMHRSGTSVVSGILHGLGVDFGDSLLGANEDNPTGHFEDTRIIKINDQILKSAQGNWAFPPSRFLIMTKGRKSEKEFVDFILKERPKRNEIWGWKDPRTCLTIEILKEHIENPHFVIVHRNHTDIAKSLARRDGSDEHANILLAEEYDNRIDLFMKMNNYPKIDINYDDLLVKPTKYVKELNKFLELGVKSPIKIRRVSKLVMSKDQKAKMRKSK